MIKIKHLTKKYNNQEVLRDINIKISSPCFIILNGPSGCGKSTLLNIISLLDSSFDGEYEFMGRNVKSLKPREKEKLIFENITYLFQEPKLIENESVKTNLELIVGHQLSKIKINELLKEFSLNINDQSIVKNLSKGEQKRVTLIGAKLRNTPIIIGDEITSGLDEANKGFVLDFLKEASKDKIVILVSHDCDVLNEYTKNVFSLTNHRIKDINIESSKRLVKSYEKNNCLSAKYLFSHIKKQIKQKRFRTLILMISLIVCLFTMGLSFLISDQMKNNLKDSLTSFYNTNQVIMTKKGENNKISKQVVDINMFDDFYNNYDDLIEKSRVFYLANFNNYFSSENYLSLTLNQTRLNLNQYGVETINQFVPLSLIDREIYPLNKSNLKQDEIIIGLSKVKIQNICSTLKLNGNDEDTLSKYFLNHHIEGTFNICNQEWEYYLEIKMKVVGFIIYDNPVIISSDEFFNERIIEDTMQLPYSYFLNEIDYYPWTTKKICALVINNDNLSNFYVRMLKDKKMNRYSFNILSKDEYPYFYELISCSLVYFTYKDEKELSYNEIEDICSKINNVNSFIPCGSDSYNVDESSLLGGFSNPSYFSFDINLNDEFIDYNSFSSGNLGSYQSSYFSFSNNNFYTLSLLDCSKSNYVRFIPYQKNKQKLKKGVYPIDETEILISKSLGEDKLGEYLYLTMLENVVYTNGKYQNIFSTQPFKVVGIVDESTKAIYQENYFPLVLSNIVFDVKNKNNSIDKCLLNFKTIKKDDLIDLNNHFSSYSFLNPLEDYLKEIDVGLNYLSTGLLVFSLITLLSSFLMIILVNYLFLKESEREIAIYFFLGYQKKSIFLQFVILSGILIFVSMGITFISLLLTSFVIPIFESSLNNFYLSFPPFLIITIISILSFITSCLISFRNFTKQDVIELIKK